MSKVFDIREVAPRYAIRRINDMSHVYCITESQAKMEIAKVSIPKDDAEQLEVTDIFESHSSKIVVIEADPDNPNYLFVINEEMRLIKIHDDGDGKAKLV